ncbi:MAG: Integral membrane protein, partial [uncultured Blastococcus sp.]
AGRLVQRERAHRPVRWARDERCRPGRGPGREPRRRVGRSAPVVADGARPGGRLAGHGGAPRRERPGADRSPGLRRRQRMGSAGLGRLLADLGAHPARWPRNDPHRPGGAPGVPRLARAHGGARRPRPHGPGAADRGGLRHQERRRPHGARVSRVVLLLRGRRLVPVRSRRQCGADVGRGPLARGGVPAARARAADLLVPERGRAAHHGSGHGVPGLPLDHRRGRRRRSGRVVVGRGSRTGRNRSVTLCTCPSRPSSRV